MTYLDNNITTQIDPEVLAVTLPFLTDNFANASSTYAFGLVADDAVKNARQALADLIGSQLHEIVLPLVLPVILIWQSRAWLKIML